jgi:two-component system, chemotaxis family, chemotaxis protein CheY
MMMMKSLVVEDEFVARCILQRFLARYGECDVAVDGDEAIDAVTQAMESSTVYDLICLDIGLPKQNGQDVLQRVRELERERGIQIGQGCRVIMTTSTSTTSHVIGAFRGGADAYLTKPISLAALSQELKTLRLVS